MTSQSAAESAPQCDDSISFDFVHFSCQLNRGHMTTTSHFDEGETDGRRFSISWTHAPVIVEGDVEPDGIMDPTFYDGLERNYRRTADQYADTVEQQIEPLL